MDIMIHQEDTIVRIVKSLWCSVIEIIIGTSEQILLVWIKGLKKIKIAMAI